jgi:UDP-N-acetylmuramate--alanine ligase
MAEAVLDIARDGDVVMCMGAGSIGGVPAKVVDMGGAA